MAGNPKKVSPAQPIASSTPEIRLKISSRFSWYQGMGLNIEGVDAKNRFYTALAGVSDPEQKRKIIGRLFIEVFEEESVAHPDCAWLGQGTIYPDVIESVSVHGPSVTIKSHHNVGGLPEQLKLKIVEPLRMLFKDEVRRVGRELGVPATILAVRAAMRSLAAGWPRWPASSSSPALRCTSAAAG